MQMDSPAYGGQIFAFSAMDGNTDWLNGLVCRVHGNRLEFKLPTAGGRLLFNDALDGIYGDCFTAGETRGALIDTHHLLIDGKFTPVDVPDSYRMAMKGNLTLIAPDAFFHEKYLDADFERVFAERKAWLDGIDTGDDKTLRRALSQLKTQLYTPTGAITTRWTTPDRWPHRNLWLWDSVFHAMALRHVDIEMAKDAIRAVFRGQEPETGFIPHMATPDGHSKITQPPVLAYGMAKLLEKDDDTGFLMELYHGNKAFLDWCAANRDRDGDGLLEWFVDDKPNCRCDESGMDNSIRFDKSAFLAAVDFNAFYARECGIMSGFAKRLGFEDDARDFAERNARTNRLMNDKLWDDEAGLYIDFDIKSGRRSGVLSSVGFLPLTSGAPTGEMASRMVALLSDPRKFGTPLPIPSVARDTIGFSTDMWRGPVWTNINMMVCEGLRQYGYGAVANEIETKTRSTIEKYFKEFGSFYEYYDADGKLPPPSMERKGYNSPDEVYHQPLRDYGWTAALYIDSRLRK